MAYATKNSVAGCHLPVQPMYRKATLRLRIGSGRVPYATNVQILFISSSHDPSRYQAVAWGPLPLLMRWRKVAFRYRPSSGRPHYMLTAQSVYFV